MDFLGRDINVALADPVMKARLADQGGTPLPGSPADFGKLIAEDTEKWAKVIRRPISRLSEPTYSKGHNCIAAACNWSAGRIAALGQHRRSDETSGMSALRLIAARNPAQPLPALRANAQSRCAPARCAGARAESP
jgi:hypothetical protein